MNISSFDSFVREVDDLTISDCIERQLRNPLRLRDVPPLRDALTDDQALLTRIREQSWSYKVRAVILMAALAEKLASDVWVRYEFTLIVIPHIPALSLLSKLYLIVNLYGGIRSQNPHNLGFFLGICATLLESVEPAQSMRLHSAAIAENYTQSYVRFLDLAQEITGTSEDFGATEAFNRISSDYGAPFILPNYVEPLASSDITDIAQSGDGPLCSVNTPSGNRPFYLFKASKKTEASPPHVSYLLKSGYFSFDISRPGFPEFYLFDENKRPIRGLCYGFRPFLEAPNLEITQAAFIDDVFPGTNLSHLMLNKLPRISLFTDVTSSFVLFADSQYLREFAATFLPKLQFKFLTASPRGTVRCRDWFTSTTSTVSYFHVLHGGAEYAQKFIGPLREQVRGYTAEPRAPRHAEKIFISRRDAQFRNATNWEALEEMMHRRGYLVICMAALGAVEQVLTAARASHIVGIHGAGLTNILYAEKCRVLEIFPSTYGSQCYCRLAKILGHDYCYYAVPNPHIDDETFKGASTVFDDLTIDLADLQRYMDQNRF